MKSVWILTREINEYDQDGEYFVNVFDHPPSAEELYLFGVPKGRLSHVQAGGGRKGYEEEWFFLREHRL